MSLAVRSAWMTLAAFDLLNIRDFYRQLLTCEPQIDLPAYVEFQLPGLRLGIFKPKPELEPVVAESGPVSLCLEVRNLQQAMAHLKTLGLEPVSELRYASHGQEIDYCDPLGTRLILYEPSARL